jgi:alkaline phosphatase D
MLDTRLHGRDVQSGTTGAVVNATTRQLLGTDQFFWLSNRLDSSIARWKILTQQVMFAPLKVLGQAINGDQWDGYPAERTRVINHIINKNISDVVVITGDIHSSWANDIPTASYNSSTGAGSAGVEFVTPSVTSPGLSLPGGATAIQLSNSHIKYTDLSQHGFYILDINNNRTQCDWFYITTIDNPSLSYNYAKSMYVNHLERFLRNTTSASLPRPSIFGALAPICPRIVIPNPAGNNEYNDLKLLNVFPNPAENQIVLSFLNNDIQSGIVTIYNSSGQKVFELDFTRKDMYNSQLSLNISALNKGIYNGTVKRNGKLTFFKFVKSFN